MIYKKLVVFLLITAVFVSSAYSTHATDWFYSVKEFGLDVAGRAIASALIRTLSSKLIQKIQTGGEGGRPTFVQNWTNFLTDSQYRGEDAFRAILASTKLCGYLDKNIKEMFGVKSTQIKLPLGQNVRVDNFDPFSLRAGCTMPSNFNLASYQTDFAGNGGWNAFSRMLEPQNNYYGLLFGSLDEAARQRNINSQAGQSEAQAGSGYTSIRGACQDQFAGTSDIGPTQPSQARCTFMGKVFTPADLLGKTAATTVDKDMEGIINSDELAETLIAISNAVVNRLGNLAESKISDAISGQDNGNNENGDISYRQNLKEEYCSASKPSKKASDTVQQESPKTFTDFPITGCSGPQCVAGFPGWLPGSGTESGRSFCDQYRNEDNPYPYQRCILACFKSLEIIPKSITTPPKPGPDEAPLPTTDGAPEEKVWACTQLGQDEQNFMLPLLNGGTSPQDVVGQTNSKFASQITAIGETEAVYYPNNNTIGLPEFYLAGPTPIRPISPQTGLPWDVVVRCTP